jgi:hypothetical protein
MDPFEVSLEVSPEIEELEAKIAPDQPPGLLGYEGQPGNQGGSQHHP